MVMTATETDRKVWVGCLACYNDGRLMGAWFDADEVGELTSDELHEANDPNRHDLKDQREGYGQHEEIWCFDIEGFGDWNHEMSPSEAFAKDAALTEICDRTSAPADAVLAWAGFTGNGHEDLDGFEDAWHGEHDSAEAFVEQMYEDMGQELGPLASYIDWARVARDWGFDGWHFHETDTGSVYVFGP